MAKKRDVSRFHPGQMVRSDAGHDRKTLYVILEIKNDILFLADGMKRSADHPKKKNIRHVRRMNYIDESIGVKLEKGESINNEDICKAIQLFEKNEGQ